MKNNRLASDLIKPRTFAKRNGIPWEYVKAIIHFRRINGLNEAGVVQVLQRGNQSLFVHEGKFLEWIAATMPNQAQ